MCELAGKNKKHFMLLKQKSMIIIAMTERESENEGSEEERQVPLKIQWWLCTWVIAADRAV